MAAPVEKQATVIAKANALQNFMSVLQIRNETDPARNSTDTAGRAKSKPLCSYCYPLTIKGKRSEARTTNEGLVTPLSETPARANPERYCDGFAGACSSSLGLFDLRLGWLMPVQLSRTLTNESEGGRGRHLQEEDLEHAGKRGYSAKSSAIKFEKQWPQVNARAF
jgi:hypothetical protein